LKTFYLNGNLQEITNDNGTITYPSLDAKTFKTMICNRSIEGATRTITMNHICDRVDIGYAVYDMNPDNGELEVYITERILIVYRAEGSVAARRSKDSGDVEKFLGEYYKIFKKILAFC
jgi:hypothetical protein